VSFLDRFRRKPKADQPALKSMSAGEYFAGDEAWIAVASSNLHSVAYYGEGAVGTLGVRFKDKKTGAVKSEYRYSGVPVVVYQGLLHAGSHGKYFRAHIRDQYLTAGPL